MQYDVIFFIGPQGSGKGTQAKLLAEKLNFFYWDMGAILRNFSKETSSLSIKVKTQIDAGILLSDELLLEVAKTKLASIPKNQGLIFDGIPRRIGQAEYLTKFLKENNRSNFLTLFINLPREESIKRILLRAEKENRKDDTREGVETRLKFYEQETIPVLEFMRENSKFVEIDGTPPVEEVTNTIDKYINS